MQERIFPRELDTERGLSYAWRMRTTILASNVAALRKHLGLNQTDFGERLGTQQANVSKWESKGVEPGGEFIEAMAEMAGISAREFRNEMWLPAGAPVKVKPAADAQPSIESLADNYGLALVEEIDLSLGMGATYLDQHVKPERKGLVPFRASWLRDMFKGPLTALKVVRGSGDSMQPTIHDGDFVLIDTSRKAIDEQDVVWAVSYGELGMIRRLRQMPNGGVLLMPDNPVVRPAEAYDGELHVLGRVIWIGRRM